MAEAATAAAKPNLEKREAILAAALRLIARFGLHNTPMSAVAREAAVAVGTVYLYFPSKEAMINALYLHVLEDRNRSLYQRRPCRGGVYRFRAPVCGRAGTHWLAGTSITRKART